MISRRTLLASGAALAASGVGAPVRASDAFAPAVDRLRRFVEDGDLPFASIRIARHGRRLAEAHVSGVEPVDANALYRIYSMTKPVVAAAVMQLVDDGRLSLDTPVSDPVPEFARLRVAGASLDDLQPARTMTVAHLLTHTCGLGNSWGASRTAPLYRQAGLEAAQWMFNAGIGGLAGFAERLAAIPLEFQPGDGWLYGYGLDIAGLVVERISGQRLGDVMQTRLFQPLGMTSTGFHVPEGQAGRLLGLYSGRGPARRRIETGAASPLRNRPVADSGSGGLVSSLADYGRFADMLAGSGAVDGVRILSPRSARVLTSPYGDQSALTPGLARFAAFGLGGSAAGVGQALGGVSTLTDDAGPGSAGEYAWGGAASTTFWSNAGSGLSVVVMTQLLPSGTVPLRDTLRPLIYRALAQA